MFVRDCKAPLIDLRCSRCGHQYEYSDEFPVLLSNDAHFRLSRQIASTYDSIYSQHSSVWEDQGRTQEFIQFFARLLAADSRSAIPGRSGAGKVCCSPQFLRTQEVWHGTSPQL